MAHDDIDSVDGDGDDDNIDNTYLTFVVDDEEYAVHVSHVTEIVRLQKSFAVPDVPDYIRGVINLRGKVIPLLDMRARFGLAEAAYTDRTVVVVLEVGETATGLVVDGVSEVAEIAPENIDTRAVGAQQGRSSMVSGMGRRADRVSFILDVPFLLAAEPPAKPRNPSRATGAAAST
jgi:purine-binding chemotaxis protein CheW